MYLRYLSYRRGNHLMRPILLLLLSVIVWPIALSATEYTEEIAAWRAQRLKRLTAEEGFLSLAGLYWLKEGDNSFGSAEDNDLVFPAGAPAHIGVFTLNTGVVSLQIESGAPVTTLKTTIPRLCASVRCAFIPLSATGVLVCASRISIVKRDSTLRA
jgi:uncharacterized protein (DUF1684 family)